MRYLIFADTHGEPRCIEAVLGSNAAEVDSVISLGDAINTGENEAENECIDILRQSNGKLCAVRGNHEEMFLFVHDKYPYYFTKGTAISPENVDYIRAFPGVLEAEGRYLFVHQGVKSDTDTWLRIVHRKDAEAEFGQMAKKYPHVCICFFGHSHKPMVFRLDRKGDVEEVEPQPEMGLDHRDKYLVCPGKMSSYPAGTPMTYAVFDSERGELKFREIKL